MHCAKVYNHHHGCFHQNYMSAVAIAGIYFWWEGQKKAILRHEALLCADIKLYVSNNRADTETL